MSQHADHFESLEVQAHATRLGMWVFLASEALLFAAMFALYAMDRAHDPAGFRDAIHHAEKLLGSLNTAVLLTSSTLVACSVHAKREGKDGLASSLVLGTVGLGALFLALKGVEYAHHVSAGVLPGRSGQFWTLYYTMTGVHALHVAIGMLVLLSGLRAAAHRLEVRALYWHLVDVIWIFLWPLFYLA